MGALFPRGRMPCCTSPCTRRGVWTRNGGGGACAKRSNRKKHWCPDSHSVNRVPAVWTCLCKSVLLLRCTFAVWLHSCCKKLFAEACNLDVALMEKLLRFLHPSFLSLSHVMPGLGRISCLLVKLADINVTNISVGGDHNVDMRNASSKLCSHQPVSEGGCYSEGRVKPGLIGWWDGI